MEGFQVEKTNIRQGDFMWKTNLKAAYFIPKSDSCGREIQYKSLPFGLESGPRMRIKSIIAILPKIGTRIVIYLDDMLLINQTRGPDKGQKLVF